MNIRIDGISLEQYTKRNDRFEEFKYTLENIEFASYDTFDYLTISNEASILGDMVKGTIKGTAKTVKYGVKGIRAADRQWTNIKNKWAQIKPQLIKVLKQMAMGLQNLWHKFLQYDEKYKELGKKISNIISFSVNQMQTMPAVKLIYHKFNAVLLKGIIDLVSNWFNFVDVIINGSNSRESGLFQGKGNMQPLPKNIAAAVKRDDLNSVKTMVQDFSRGIGNLNVNGDLTIGVILDRLFKWDLIKYLPKEQRDAANKNEIGLAEYIKYTILGEEIEAEYSDANKNDFVRDMTGSKGAYLHLVASILNNDVLADALKKGGASTKKGTDSMVKALEDLMKQADVAEKIKKDKEAKDAALKAKQEAAKKPVENKNENDMNDLGVKDYDAGQQFGSSTDSHAKMEAGAYKGDGTGGMEDATLSDLTELYSKNYVIFVTKLSNTYANLVRGILAATYEIISEADSIINIIETSANRTKA